MKLPTLPDKIGGSATVTGVIYTGLIFMGFFLIVLVAFTGLVAFGYEETAIALVNGVLDFGKWFIGLIAGALGARTVSSNAKEALKHPDPTQGAHDG